MVLTLNPVRCNKSPCDHPFSFLSSLKSNSSVGAASMSQRRDTIAESWQMISTLAKTDIVRATLEIVPLSTNSLSLGALNATKYHLVIPLLNLG